MKKVILLLVLFVSVFLVGCGSGVVDSRADRNRRIAAVLDLNDRQIRDDSDEFWLVNQNCNLMEWNLYIGK